MKTENKNRKIKFRWKDSTGQWIHGTLLVLLNHPVIFVPKVLEETGNVLKETLGQFTGAKDKTGKEIYEGDVLKLIFKDNYSDLEMEGVVKFCQDHLSFNCFDGTYKWGSPLGKWSISEMEIIGNVFDNPEYKERFKEVFNDET